MVLTILIVLDVYVFTMLLCRSRIQPTLYTPYFVTAVTVYGEGAAKQVIAKVNSAEGVYIREGNAWYVLQMDIKY